MSRDTTIVFQSPNHLGLGHIARLSNIALAMQRIAPSARIVFAVAGMGHPTLEARQLPYIPLPLETPVFRAAWSAWSDGERERINFLTCDATLAALNPSAVVFDCFPHASFSKAAMNQARRLVLVLRGMRDLDAYLARRADLLSKIGLFIIAEEVGSIKLPKRIETRSVFAGQITTVVRPEMLGDATEKHDRVTITITGGGGGSPKTLQCYNLFLDALREVHRLGRSFECTLVTGPLFRSWPELRLFGQVKILPFAADMSHLYSRSDLILSLAGYNTLLELRTLARRIICCPIETIQDDQFARAARVAKDNPNVKVFGGADPVALASIICNHLGAPVIEVSSPRSFGAEIAAKAIISFLAGR